MSTELSGSLRYLAYHICDRIDLRSYKTDHPTGLVKTSSTDLYYHFAETGQYYSVVAYGAVLFANYSNDEAKAVLEALRYYCEHFQPIPDEDTLNVVISKSEPMSMSFTELTVPEFNHEVNRMIMLHLAQTVTLDHFNGLSQKLLAEVRTHAARLETHGQIRLGKREMMRFIGKTLNAKNDIAGNLYIFDSPDNTWENEFLSSLHHLLSKNFELSSRHRSIDQTLQIIESNLQVFISHSDHRESSRLEWIIIVLIVIEVVDTFVAKLF